jgi:hypothetical protein
MKSAPKSLTAGFQKDSKLHVLRQRSRQERLDGTGSGFR